MCTLVILRRPEHRWPVVIGANRDEMIDRPWQPPGRHWPDRPEVVAGLDTLAGGSWLGINDWGVAAAVLNRHGSLGPAPDRRSRGELVLEALDHADAVAAAEALSHLDPGAYRTFNLIVADDATGSGSLCRRRSDRVASAEGRAVDDRRRRYRRLSPPGASNWRWRPSRVARADPSATTGRRGIRCSAAPEHRRASRRPQRCVSGPTATGYIECADRAPRLGQPDRKPIFRFAGWLPEVTPWRDVLSDEKRPKAR
jgi:hypothetical protein